MVLGRSPAREKPTTTTTTDIIEQRLRSEAAAAAQRPTATRPIAIKEKWTTARGPNTREFEASLGPSTHERVIGSYTPHDPSPAWDHSVDILGADKPFHRSTPSGELERQSDGDSVEEIERLTRKKSVRMDISGGELGAKLTATTRTEAAAAQPTAAAVAQPAAAAEAAKGAKPKTPAPASTTTSSATESSRGVWPAAVGGLRTEAEASTISTTNPFGGTLSVTVTNPAATARPLRGAGDLISPIPHLNPPVRPTDTFTTHSGAGLLTTARPESSPVAAAIAKGCYLLEVVDAEYGEINVDNWTADLLQDLCLEANAHKKALAKVEEKLVGVPAVQRHREAFAAARSRLLRFLREAQHRICAQQEVDKRIEGRPQAAPQHSQPVPAPPAAQADRRSALSVKLKHDRVIAQEHRLVHEMSAVIEEAQALQKVAPEGDTQVQVSLEKGRDLKDRGAELAREALALYSDAVDAELEESAKSIYDCMQLMQSTNRDTMTRLAEVKVLTRVGLTSRARDTDFPAPTFSGASDEDVYKFLDLFDQYLDARGLSEIASLRAMRTVCLKGQLAITCGDMDHMPNLRSYLLDVYGQPRVLLDNKLKDFAKLGKCPVYPADKRRDWLIKTQNQLNHLLKICKKFALMDELMFSPILRLVYDNLPSKVQQEYLENVAELPREERTRRRFFRETIDLITKQVAQATADVNANHILGLREVERQVAKKAVNHADIEETVEIEEFDDEELEVVEVRNQPRVKKTRSRRKPQSTVHQVELTINYTEPQVMACVACPGKHSHMFYCQEFQRAGVDDRIQMAKAQGACRRCLRMDSKLDLSNRSAWFAKHEPDCKTEWTCSYEWTCGKASTSAQIHMVLCKRHSRFNKEKEGDFIKSLDQTKVGPNTRFFFTSFSLSTAAAESAPRAELPDDKRVIKTTKDRAIYMMQTAYNDAGVELLLFYDSGCSVAAISERAAEALNSRNLIPGPTNLNVAGGQVVENQGGVDEFELELAEGDAKVQMRGLVMDTVTNPFAMYDLQEAYEDLCKAYGRGEGAALPAVPNTIGGSKVDIMVGIKYLAYYPELVFSLPSGLAIYESRIKSLCGSRGVIGGPHRSWRHAEERIEFMSSFAFLAAELRAYRAQANALDGGLVEAMQEEWMKPWEDMSQCCGCGCHEGEQIYSMQEDTRRFAGADGVGAEVTYRCVRCRNCADCRRGELLEEASLQEESEQALIEQSVWLEPAQNRMVCSLPFVKNPVTSLVDNRQQAEKIFASQLRSFSKNPAMREAVLAAHDKLLSKGHVAAVDQLTSEERKVMDQTEGAYVLPWSCVAKVDSISTPFRVVFNASFRTKSGESLNSTLAKGANKLPLILSLLLRFRARRYALAADVSMAYNSVKLIPQHYKYQQYLWKEGLVPESPTITMIIKTLIYGVRPSGNLTGAGFVKVAEYAKERYPHLEKGAKVIREDTYVDDSVASFDTAEEAQVVASAMVEVLSLGGATIKDFAFSGIAPSEKLSSDGCHVGVLGYSWATVEEDLFLAVRPTVLGRGRTAKRCIDNDEDIWEALKQTFTKRTLQGQLARIYDPLGLATPITAMIKLNLAEVVALKTDWDDKLPEQLLPKWVDNLIMIQRLRKVSFPRSIMPDCPMSTRIQLIISVDASKDVAVAAVHARVPLASGGFSCKLLAAKSKLVHTSTVPKGELRAAVMGASLAFTVSSDLGSQVEDVLFVTDSTIVLFWLTHDTRPLQTAVRNAVIEIRRFSAVDQWYHVASEDNVADLGTRPVELEEVGPESDWINGRPWMAGPRDNFPLRDIGQVSLDAEEARIAAREVKVGEASIHATAEVLSKVQQRYEYSRYIVDPCNASWPKAVNVLAAVFRFVSKLQSAVQRRKEGNPVVPLPSHLQVVHISADERRGAELYFFRKATQEVKKFMSKADYENCTIEKDGVLYYKSRVLDGQVIEDHDGILGDVKPLHFVRPVAERHSPVSYSIMRHIHDDVAHHMNVAVMVRESRELCFIFKGRDLAIEVATLCKRCKKTKAEKVETEMAKQHQSTLRVGPAFSVVQVDMAGPWFAECEHTCRSSVKVWALVFKDPATCAVAAYAMPASNSAGFVQAYNRHAFRYGHPMKVYVDAGSQLLKACEQAEMSWLEISHLISAHYGVGFDYEVCPPHAHYFHGAVERSIKEIKRLFNNMFKGLKLHLLAYETAFAYCCNTLNNLPIALGSRTDHLGHRDVLTPNRLLMGRNNKRSPDSITQVPSNSRLAEQLEEVERSWWKLWASEKLVDFVPQPAKWPRSNNNIAVGMVVIFPMAKPKAPIGEFIWKYGKVAEILPSSDGLARRVKITYQNYKEEVWRFVTRGAREVAVIHSEDDLEFFRLMREEAAKLEKEVFVPKQAWQGLPHEEDADEGDHFAEVWCECVSLQ